MFKGSMLQFYSSIHTQSCQTSFLKPREIVLMMQWLKPSSQRCSLPEGKWCCGSHHHILRIIRKWGYKHTNLPHNRSWQATVSNRYTFVLSILLQGGMMEFIDTCVLFAVAMIITITWSEHHRSIYKNLPGMTMKKKMMLYLLWTWTRKALCWITSVDSPSNSMPIL